jgi:flagellar hook assembly protein FlgD
LNPTDGVQFLSQLAQFSQLEQLVDIRSGIDVLAGTVQGSIDTGESA